MLLNRHQQTTGRVWESRPQLGEVLRADRSQVSSEGHRAIRGADEEIGFYKPRRSKHKIIAACQELGNSAPRSYFLLGCGRILAPLAITVLPDRVSFVHRWRCLHQMLCHCRDDGIREIFMAGHVGAR